MRRIVDHEDVLNVLESSELFDFFAAYFGEAALTFKYKWLRAVGNEQYTGAHYDFVYMGRGSGQLHTVWIPYGDTTVDHDTLAVCRGSHNLPSFARIGDTYGRMDVDATGSTAGSPKTRWRSSRTLAASGRQASSSWAM